VPKAAPETKPAPAPTEPAKPATATDVKANTSSCCHTRDKKVDAKSIQPSGSNGRIMKQDVLEALSNLAASPEFNSLAAMTALKK
jgi:2-oxoglutarate dehydrogenase E2 component (dihydrolipoamide succinyltransferase)